MVRQLNHSEIIKEYSPKEIVLIAEHIERPSNVGGLIRTAESLGVRKVIFVSNEMSQLTTKMKRSSRSAENFMEINFCNKISELLMDYIDNDYELIALEYTTNSIALNEYHSTKDKLVIICGNERRGVSPETLDVVSTQIKIPVYGTTTSLNVVVATGIALHQLNSN